MAGGALVYMLALLGDRIAPSALAAGIGVLFMARGIGTGIGPIVVRRLFPDRHQWPSVIGGAVILCGLCYVGVGLVPWSSSLPLVVAVCTLVVMGHAASGGNWVLSTVILQKRTEDRYRGRVFSTDWLFVMSAESLSILVGSALLEFGWLTLEGAVLVFAGLQVASGLAWLAIVVPRERRDEQAEAAVVNKQTGSRQPTETTR
jgi:uncharacterized membrane protein